MSEKGIIIGAGLHGKMIAEIITHEMTKKQVQWLGFVDDDPALKGKRVDGIPILGRFSELSKLIVKNSITSAIVGLSDAHMERRGIFFQKLRQAGLNGFSVRHPSSIISNKVKLGEGIFIAAGVVVNPFSTIGDNVVLYTGATVDHNNTIANNVWIAPGVHLAGDVAVGENTLIGIGACVIPHVKIGRNVTVGAGSVVIRDIPDDVVVVGVPARIIEHKKQDRRD